MKKLIIALLILTPLALTVACSRDDKSSPSTAQEARAISHYTCSMHPQIHADHPGKCPICGMDLVPVYQD